jgi:hypothetical protein
MFPFSKSAKITNNFQIFFRYFFSFFINTFLLLFDPRTIDWRIPIANLSRGINGYQIIAEHHIASLFLHLQSRRKLKETVIRWVINQFEAYNVIKFKIF